MQIKTWRDPYEAGFSPTKPTQIELNPGLTVLVGCNGAGKTTLLNNIKEVARKQNIPCHMFDNLRDGGNGAISFLFSGLKEFDGDGYGLGGLMFSSSEGENIRLNIGRQSTKYKEFLKTGFFSDKVGRLSRIFAENVPEIATDNRRILLFDAVDSGMSVDAVCEIKELFKLVLEDAKEIGVETYIIIAANEYELCRNEQCFDVVEGKYRTFADYEDYRKFILKSRVKKEKRLEKQEAFWAKQAVKEEKEYEAIKAKTVAKIEKIRSDKNLSESMRKWKIQDAKRELDDFVRRAEYGKYEYLED